MNKIEVKTKISQAYPDLTIDTLEFLGEGFDSEAFLINQSYVFKFPRHTRAARNLYKEALILDGIKNQLPLKVPEIFFIGKSSKSDQLEFVGYEKIEGVPLNNKILDTLTEKQKDELAQELAIFFKALHKVELPIAIKGLEVDKKTKAAYEYNVIKKAAFPLLKESVQQEIDEVYRKILQHDYNDKKCLIHNDFGASNVYFDLMTNKICGLIDFGDVAIYDREMEFICLLFDYEEGFSQVFVEKMMDYYGLKIEELQNKLAFVEFYNQLENVYLGKEFGMDELFAESIAEIKAGLKGYEENILLDDRTIYYM